MGSRNLLYHYTDASGVLGILRNNSIWATNALYLNDAEEIRFGADKLADRLMAEARSITDDIADVDPETGLRPSIGAFPSPDGTPLTQDQLDRDAKNTRATMLASASDAIGAVYAGQSPATVKDPNVYVASFTELEDDLSQWRGYGDATNGFAIGFDRGSLDMKVADTSVRKSDREDPPAPWGPQLIEYGDKAVEGLAARITGDLLRSSTALNASQSGMFHAVLDGVRGLALVKHHSFRSEHEWRVVLSSPFRPVIPEVRAGGPAGLLTYVPLKFNKMAVRTITVGPGDRHELRAKAVTHALARYKYTDVRVEPSEIPFRP